MLINVFALVAALSALSASAASSERVNARDFLPDFRQGLTGSSGVHDTVKVFKQAALQRRQQSVNDVMLKAHNDLRAQHGADPLTISSTMTSAATSWANKCIYQHGGGVQVGSGENIAAYTVDTSPLVGSNMWAAEAPLYNPNNLTDVIEQAGHFTQMVWKGTTQLGCALKFCYSLTYANGQQTALGPNARFLVCEYFPQGNVFPDSNFLANVQP